MRRKPSPPACRFPLRLPSCALAPHHSLSLSVSLCLTPQSDDIAYFAGKRQTGVSLKTLTDTGKGDFVHLVDGLIDGPSDIDDDDAMQKMLFQVSMGWVCVGGASA